jgi:hypothetical protein
VPAEHFGYLFANSGRLGFLNRGPLGQGAYYYLPYFQLPRMLDCSPRSAEFTFPVEQAGKRELVLRVRVVPDYQKVDLLLLSGAEHYLESLGDELYKLASRTVQAHKKELSRISLEYILKEQAQEICFEAGLVLEAL